jgi:starch synthase
MRVAFLTAELAPHAHVGGLGDVARSLPAALELAGDDVTVFLPRYDNLDLAGRHESPVPGLESLELGPLGEASITTLDGPGPRVLLVNAPEWFSTGRTYAGDDLDHLRYAVLCQGTIAACDVLGWRPHVVHSNDWHTAMFPLYATEWRDAAFVLTIHNLAYQGWFPRSDLESMGLDPAHPLLAGSPESINPLDVGIQAADVVTTVSPTYAREIVTPEHGSGLDGVLRAKGDRLVGILNGIGTEWDPATDHYLPARYAADSIDRKAASTSTLRARLSLDDRPQVPVAGIVSRLATQKGFDLFRTTIPKLLTEQRLQLAVLGSGEDELERLFTDLASEFPRDVGHVSAFDPELAHLIEAGADIFLMPSRWEPCGLNQMYSQKYGTVPIVHRTGGLADTVAEWNPKTGTGTGFTFDDFGEAGFLAALERAVAAFADHSSWIQLQRNGMGQDFSWGDRATEYRTAYDLALKG